MSMTKEWLMEQEDHDVLAVEVERLHTLNARLLVALEANGETIARLEDENAALWEQLDRLVNGAKSGGFGLMPGGRE